MRKLSAAVAALGVVALAGCGSSGSVDEVRAAVDEVAVVDVQGELGVSYSADDYLSGESFAFTVESVQVSDDPSVCPSDRPVAGGDPSSPDGYFVVLEMTADASDLSPGVEVDPTDAGFDLTDSEGWKDPGPIQSYEAFLCEGFAGFSGSLKSGQKAAFHVVLESDSPEGVVTVHGVEFPFSA